MGARRAGRGAWGVVGRGRGRGERERAALFAQDLFARSLARSLSPPCPCRSRRPPPLAAAQNADYLARVLHVLRSGREGAYPDLEHVTEQCLAALNPKHKALRKDRAADRLGSLPKDTRQAVEQQLAALERGEAAGAALPEPSPGTERPPVRQRAHQQVKFGTASKTAQQPAAEAQKATKAKGKKKAAASNAQRIPG